MSTLNGRPRARMIRIGVALGLAFLLALPSAAQTITSVPAVNSVYHGVSANYWLAWTSGPVAPTSWRILSIVGPPGPGLTVSTSGGNVAVSGGGPTPFEPWISPGVNLFTATAVADAPPRIETWTIFTEAIGPGPGSPSVGSSLLIVSHGPPIVLPFTPIGGGRPPGGTWNVQCHPKHPVIPHGGAINIQLVPVPNTPPPPATTTYTFTGTAGHIGAFSNGTVTATQVGPVTSNTFTVACAPEHPDGIVQHILYFRARSRSPNRVELEKCVVYCDHTDGDVFFGLFVGLDSTMFWLDEQELDPGTENSLMAKLINAQNSVMAMNLEAAVGQVSAFQQAVSQEDLEPAVAETASALAERLLAALLAAGS